MYKRYMQNGENTGQGDEYVKGSETASVQGRLKQAQTLQPGKRGYNRGFISKSEDHKGIMSGIGGMKEEQNRQLRGVVGDGSEQAKRKQLLIKCEIKLWNSLPWDVVSKKAYTGRKGGY